MGPGSVWTGAENLAPSGIRSPDRPARSESIYRLRYPAHVIRYEDADIICYGCTCIFERLAITAGNAEDVLYLAD